MTSAKISDFFYPLPTLSLSQISWFCSFRLLFGDPLPPATAEIIYGSPLTSETKFAQFLSARRQWQVFQNGGATRGEKESNWSSDRKEDWHRSLRTCCLMESNPTDENGQFHFFVTKLRIKLLSVCKFVWVKLRESFCLAAASHSRPCQAGA